MQMSPFQGIGNTNLFWIAVATGDRQNNTLQEAVPRGTDSNVGEWGRGVAESGPTCAEAGNPAVERRACILMETTSL